MATTLPARIQTQRVAPRGESFAGEFAVAGLPRLAESLASDRGTLALAVKVSRDRQGRDWANGRVTGELELQCQRCLQAFTQAVEVPLHVQLVYDEQEEERALAQAEPYLVPPEGLSVRELVEDEVLLALPMAARCPACAGDAPPA